MKLVDIINLTTYSHLSQTNSVSTLHWSVSVAWRKDDARFTGLVYGFDSHSYICSIYLLVLLSQEHITPSRDMPLGQISDDYVCDIINNSEHERLPIPLSLLFSSCPATHLCSTRVPRRSRVWLEFIWTSPRRRTTGAKSLICAGGLRINSSRRPVLRQPAWYILIEQRLRGGEGVGGQ